MKLVTQHSNALPSKKYDYHNRSETMKNYKNIQKKTRVDRADKSYF